MPSSESPSSSTPGTYTTPDGAQLVYELHGIEHLKTGKKPLVFVCGMSNRRCDFDRIVPALARNRAILTYDHRGIGDSKLPPSSDTISIDIMAKDLMRLIQHLGQAWKEIVICGFSMGGVILQHLLLLPYHPDPLIRSALSFKVTHAILAATLPSPSIFLDAEGNYNPNSKYGLKFPKPPKDLGRPLTHAEKSELVKPVLEKSFDSEWLADTRNRVRWDELVGRMTEKRPLKVILRQSVAMLGFNLPPHTSLPFPPSGPKILVIHGYLDAITPFLCAQDLLRLLPHAKLVQPPEVPNLEFGHNWMEYFEPKVWVAVMNGFIEGKETYLEYVMKAKL